MSSATLFIVYFAVLFVGLGFTGMAIVKYRNNRQIFGRLMLAGAACNLLAAVAIVAAVLRR